MCNIPYPTIFLCNADNLPPTATSRVELCAQACGVNKSPNARNSRTQYSLLFAKGTLLLSRGCHSCHGPGVQTAARYSCMAHSSQQQLARKTQVVQPAAKLSHQASLAMLFARGPTLVCLCYAPADSACSQTLCLRKNFELKNSLLLLKRIIL